MIFWCCAYAWCKVICFNFNILWHEYDIFIFSYHTIQCSWSIMWILLFTVNECVCTFLFLLNKYMLVCINKLLYTSWLLATSRKSVLTAQKTIKTSGARLTKVYDVTIQRYRNSHAKIEDSEMHISWSIGSKFCVKFQGAFGNFTQNFEPIHCKICILWGVWKLNLMTYLSVMTS